jgi:hypothetical protein
MLMAGIAAPMANLNPERARLPFVLTVGLQAVSASVVSLNSPVGRVNSPI